MYIFHVTVGGLADERVRWLSTVSTIEAGVANVIGDILLCSGAVAYLTPFTDEYRRDLLGNWIDVIAEETVPHTPKVVVMFIFIIFKFLNIEAILVHLPILLFHNIILILHINIHNIIFKYYDRFMLCSFINCLKIFACFNAFK